MEDDATIRALIVNVLTDLGLASVEAGDGPAGLDILQSPQQIDLLITDMGLPGLNGGQVAEGGRKHRPGLKVLFMTGYSEGAAVADGFLLPGMNLLTKPFSLEALADRIKQMLSTEPPNVVR